MDTALIPTIFSIGKGIPPYSLGQIDIAKHLSKLMLLDDEQAWLLERIYKNSQIEKRYSVLPYILHPDHGKPTFGMSARNAIYKKEAPILAEAAARHALSQWDRPLKDITHVVSVSCTGAITPGLELKITKALQLPPSTSRLGINFMGCFGGFKGLSVAHKIASENPKNRILLVCTELCTLHFHLDNTAESFVIHSLFADGASAAIIGSSPRSGENPLFELTKEASALIDHSEEEMTWDASDVGFDMTLSAKVPQMIEQEIQSFVTGLVGKSTSLTAYDWAIHPGGKAILEAIEKSLNLSRTHTSSSWNVLAKHGNLSSATLLYVLDDIIVRQPKAPFSICLGFGPGLSIEGLLLKNVQYGP